MSDAALVRTNASLYAEANVKDYWIVLAPERHIEVYRQPENGRYTKQSVIGNDAIVECASVPPMRIRVSDLFANPTVRSIGSRRIVHCFAYERLLRLL